MLSLRLQNRNIIIISLRIITCQRNLLCAVLFCWIALIWVECRPPFSQLTTAQRTAQEKWRTWQLKDNSVNTELIEEVFLNTKLHIVILKLCYYPSCPRNFFGWFMVTTFRYQDMLKGNIKLIHCICYILWTKIDINALSLL